MLTFDVLPMMMWSRMEMPSGFAVSMISLVISTSARDGVGVGGRVVVQEKTALAIALMSLIF
jgi:hypothetical protein